MTSLLITSARSADKPQIAQLIASVNSSPAHHCLHCDQEEKGILNELAMLEVPMEESFVAAWDGEQMVGVLGADLALERDRAWLWGPFVVGAERKNTPPTPYGRGACAGWLKRVARMLARRDSGCDGSASDLGWLPSETCRRVCCPRRRMVEKYGADRDWL